MKQNLLLLLVGLSFFGLHSSGQSSGNCLSFDGSNDFISTPLPSLISAVATSDFTIEVWIKPQSTTFSRVFYAQSDLNNFATFSLTGILEPIFISLQMDPISAYSRHKHYLSIRGRMWQLLGMQVSVNL